MHKAIKYILFVLMVTVSPAYGEEKKIVGYSIENLWGLKPSRAPVAIAKKPRPRGRRPSSDISGLWQGPGYATLKNGKKVFVRCRVNYDRESEIVFSVKSVCATRSVRLLQSGSISSLGGEKFIGQIRNDEYDLDGRVRVVRTGKKMVVRIFGDTGTARLLLTKR